MPKKSRKKSKTKAKSGKRGKKKEKHRRLPTVPSMRNAIIRTLDKVGFNHQVMRDNRNVLIVADSIQGMTPFTINLATGKVEDIDINKGEEHAESENPGAGVDGGPDNATHVAS